MIQIGFAYGGHGVCYCMFVKAFQTRVVNSYFCIVIGQRYNLILHETKDKRNVNRARYIESYLLSLFDIPNTCTDTCTQLLRSSYHIYRVFLSAKISLHFISQCVTVAKVSCRSIALSSISTQIFPQSYGICS